MSVQNVTANGKFPTSFAGGTFAPACRLLMAAVQAERC
jgi:hypothetical protein